MYRITTKHIFMKIPNSLHENSYYRHFLVYQRLFATRPLLTLTQRSAVDLPCTSWPPLSEALSFDDIEYAKVTQTIRSLPQEESDLVAAEVAKRMKTVEGVEEEAEV